MSKRRVVITGLGTVTCLGYEKETVWSSLVAGRTGIARISRFDTTGFDVTFGGEVKDFDPVKWLPAHEVKHHDLVAQFVIAAGDLCVKDAGIDFPKEDTTRIGVILGSGIGGIGEIETQHERLMKRGPSRVSPYLVPKLMMNAISGQLSIRYGLRGPNYVTASACASSAHALGAALRAIQYDEADAVLTGGSEAALTPLGLAGFCALRGLSTRNDQPERASRPFDKNRDGFVMGEGSGILLFEELEHAKKRGARMYAEVYGFGMSADAHHITAPAPDGEGAARAMNLALKDGALNPSDVDYVNAHGTSTPLNDVVETRAIKHVFGSHAKKLAISSSKSMIGHLLGASGAVELAITALSIERGTVHPTINYETPDPECDLDYVPNEARELAVRAAISNSLGFGGHNATIAVGRVRN
ncbi:MAG: beta-ketoacyl-ACP synthase II [Planctomycetes bacterium]|nr:beta-ketoacyl-ACP synthase II [Planctomycetota bacterium]MBI3844648.1 beta-ketoacyl-ACP synthase II [Planctomycetota bacterium]